MNTDIFWRLVWKEYRQQRALWTAIALAGLILQVAVLLFCSLNGVSDLSNRLFTVALSVPVLYSLGCGAALFAGEHEAETFPFQQSLPVSAGRVFFAKFAFAASSALLLFPVLWLLAFAMASWKLPDGPWHLQLWGGGVVAALEVLIWSVLGSLILRRVLPAAVVSGVTAALLGCGSLVLMMAFGDPFERQANEYFSTLPLRSCFALMALAIAVKFGRLWFNERAIRWSSSATQSRHLVEAARASSPVTGLTVLMRLVWHEWRQGRATMMWSVLGYVVLGTWLAISQSDRMAYAGLLPLLGAIYGASLFAADQRQSQYQFFAEHGVRPRLVWLSRQLVWGVALLVVVIFGVAVQSQEPHLPSAVMKSTCLALVGFTILMFAAGQVCSILIRSPIVAVFTTALCGPLLGLWVGPLGNLGVPWLISSIPLPFAFFWVSWRYAPSWIEQRQTWRVRIVTAASISVPLLCVVAATAAYRVYEIPAVELSFDSTILPSEDSLAARKTATMYEEADRLLRQRLALGEADTTTISPRDREWQQGIDLFIAASQRETCRFDHWDEGVLGSEFDGKQLTRSVLAEATTRAEEGDLEGAAKLHVGLLRLAGHFYRQHAGTGYRRDGMAVEYGLYSILPAWADHESLTPVRIRETLTYLQTWAQSNAPDWESSLIENRHIVRQFVELDGRFWKGRSRETTERLGIKTLGVLLVSERWRMSRLLDVSTATELQGIREILARGPRIPPQAQKTLPWDVRLTSSGTSPKLIRSTDTEAWLLTTRWPGMNSRLIAPDVASWIQQYQAQRGAVQQQLALIAWRKEDGKLPDALDQLLGDPFEALPLDPYTKEPFVYFPNGIEEEVWDDETGVGSMQMMGGMSSTSGAGLAPMKSRFARSEPFLWSPGENLRYVPGMRHGPSESPIASDFRDQNGNALSERSLLHQGVRYPIPQAQQQSSDSSADADADALPNDE